MKIQTMLLHRPKQKDLTCYFMVRSWDLERAWASKISDRALSLLQSYWLGVWLPDWRLLWRLDSVFIRKSKIRHAEGKYTRTCLYSIHRTTRNGANVDYPANKSDQKLNSTVVGDRRLAQSAQMFHYQHEKQRIIAMEKYLKPIAGLNVVTE